MVGVLVWGEVRKGVGGTVGGVMGFTLGWVAFAGGVCIMNGVRFKGKPRQRGGGREVPRRGTNNE